MPYLRPATQYEFWVIGFTQKREGVASQVLRTRTDTAKPGPPVITNTNCTGAFHIWIFNFQGVWSLEVPTIKLLVTLPPPGDGDILLEWRRPATTHGRVNFYVIYYKSDQVAIRMSLTMTNEGCDVDFDIKK